MERLLNKCALTSRPTALIACSALKQSCSMCVLTISFDALNEDKSKSSGWDPPGEKPGVRLFGRNMHLCNNFYGSVNMAIQ